MTNTFASKLINWYNLNKRDLPWRKTTDPYKIWVSEIILQQTRVNQGLEYYNRFTQKFPDIKTLAKADITDVLKMWQGLGYYNRVRNMHNAAKEVLTKFNGVFPNNLEQIISLKGIGEYTSAAILSFAYKQPYPVVDGNVKRVITRYFGIESPINITSTIQEIKIKLETVFDKSEPGTFNQAIMELGALICLPYSPKCGKCVQHKNCVSRKKGKTHLIPIIEKNKKITDRYFNYIVPIIKKDKTWFSLLFERSKKDVWQGLYEFPLFETKTIDELSNTSIKKNFEKKYRLKISKILYTSPILKHKLSHQKINTQYFICEIRPDISIDTSEFLPFNEIKKLPVSSLVDQIVKTTVLTLSKS